MHVAWRMHQGVWNLRSRRCFKALETAFSGGANPDPYTSQVAVIAPETFLMRRLC